MTTERYADFLARPARFDLAERYAAGDHDPPYLPDLLQNEHRQHARRAVCNVTGLAVRHLSNSLVVAGMQGRGAEQAWGAWRGAELPRLHKSIREIALKHGEAYAVVRNAPGGRTMSVHGPDTCRAFYDDPVNDLWPRKVHLAAVTKDGRRAIIKLEGDKRGLREEFERNSRGSTETYLGDEQVEDNPVLAAGEYPAVVRFRLGPVSYVSPCRDRVSDEVDPIAWGRVLPLVHPQDSLNQARLDLSLARTFGAFNLRMLSGVSLSYTETPEPGASAAELAAYRAKMRREKLEVIGSRMLSSDNPEARIDTAPGTDIRPFIDDVRLEAAMFAMLASTGSAVPAGDRINLSADAIYAERAPEDADMEEMRAAMADPYERLIHLLQGGPGRLLEGVEINYRQVPIESLSGQVMAYATAVRDIGVAPEVVVPKIRGFSRADVEQAEELGLDPSPQLPGEDRSMDELARSIGRGSVAGAGEDRDSRVRDEQIDRNQARARNA